MYDNYTLLLKNSAAASLVKRTYCCLMSPDCFANSQDGGVFYRKQLTLKNPSSACEVKVISRSACLCVLFPLSSSAADPSAVVPAALSGWTPHRFAVPSGRRDVAGTLQPGVWRHNRHAAGAESGRGDGSQSVARGPESDGHGPCPAAGE